MLLLIPDSVKHVFLGFFYDMVDIAILMDSYVMHYNQFSSYLILIGWMDGEIANKNNNVADIQTRDTATCHRTVQTVEKEKKNPTYHKHGKMSYTPQHPPSKFIHIILEYACIHHIFT